MKKIDQYELLERFAYVLMSLPLLYMLTLL